MSHHLLNTVAMMIKNEEKTIRRTFRSVRNWVNKIVIYDTGSTDDTLKIISKMCKDEFIDLVIHQGEFVDFSTSRNRLLAFCEEDPEIDYVLLLDANDEVEIDWEQLKIEEGKTAYNIRQRWLEETGAVNEYYNVRFLKLREGWYYRGRIHEDLFNDDLEKLHPDILKGVVLVQERKHDFEKTRLRLPSDIQILTQDYLTMKEKGNTSENSDFYRCLNYLGQTHVNLAIIPDTKLKLYHYGMALKNYIELINLFREKFNNKVEFDKEQYYNSLLLAGCITQTLEQPWKNGIEYFNEAIDLWPQRCEAFIPIIEHYVNSGSTEHTLLAFMYSNFICRLSCPHININVNKLMWDAIRWKLYAIICLEVGANNADIFLAGREALDVFIKGAKDCKYELSPSEEDLIQVYKETEVKVVNKMSEDAKKPHLN